MTQSASRTERARARRAERNARMRRLGARVAIGLAVAALAVGLLALAVITTRNGMHFAPHESPARAVEQKPVQSATRSRIGSAALAAGNVEVPELRGMPIDEATAILGAAGLSPKITEEGTAAASSARMVVAQTPAARTVAAAGAVVTIVVPPLSGALNRRVFSERKRSAKGIVIVIDPGHQSHPDSKTEPIGPGASQSKARCTGGATGAVTGVPEYEVNLQIATNIAKRLKAAGVHVVMTRSTNDVDLSNAERAQIANDAQARLLVRVHSDSVTDPLICGASTLYPAENKWTRSIVSESRRAAGLIQSAVVRATGAVNRGVQQRDDQSGFNWSRVPAVLVETGFQSNPVEDRLLTSPHYQDEVAQGVADGVFGFLGIAPQ